MPELGICALCLKAADLQESHLMPKAIYRLQRSPGRKNPNPVVLTKKSAVITSRQVWAHLLCWDCEQRFRRQGEDWTMEHSHREGQGFKLQDLLKQATPFEADDAFAFYSTRLNPEINADPLTYFGASVFWRAAVHTWRGPDVTVGLDLGPYQEPLRKYLMGDTSFPDNTAVLVGVSVLPKPQNTTNFPHGRRRETYRHYEFHIPGITFDLFVGSGTPRYLRLLSISHSPERFVYASEMVDRRNHESMLKSFKGAARYLGRTSPSVI